MIKNIKHGLGVITNLGWVNQLPEHKDSESRIITTQDIQPSKNICKLFHHEGIDVLHREYAQSFEIKVNSKEEFEKIIIHNKGNCDVTIIINQAKAVLIEVQDASDQQLITTGLSIHVEENVDVQIAVNIKNKKDSLHLLKEICTTKNDAKVTWFTHTDGTRQVILDQKANLIGNNSEIKTISTVTADKGDHFDVATISHHIGQHTKSDILFKSVLAGAKVLARGLVRIEPTAAHSQGYQTSNILLLDKDARAITIPDLEIENKDVMCSHGSTITSISEEKLFYLKSRGISEEQAKELIIQGFIDDMYNQLDEKISSSIRGQTT